MNQTEMTMGRRIAARRKELKMTQEALAQELGVSAQAVSKWENDLSCPDISILPKLAKTLGLTTDALLGAEPEGPVSPALPVPADPEEEDDRPGIYVESDNGRKWDIHFDAPKKASFSLAGWLICTALLMLIGPLLKINGANSIGFWSAVWISALIVWGVDGMIRHIRFSNVVATLGGVYFALEGLGLIDLELGWGIVFPVLILLLGVSLLIDGIRKKDRPGRVHIIGSGDGSAEEMGVKDGWLVYSSSFGEDTYLVSAPELKGGDISVSFGEHTLDFSGVEKVAEDCTVELNSSFGEVHLRIPRRYRLNFVTSKNFAETDVQGQPDAFPEGTINLVSSLNFGELSIVYI